ncbi:baeRF7 domain-containing protein [Aliterella atlantica]|uniref:Uncharacterized protein n=1 Tax=Aliterella atlantica CENA595 TaxID=1618023 RepID=A0A0D8ZQV5_9CYAN|nr:hypothetical protein [Aliterella atlantica]KJH70712.1 hypothetical protein UH38_16835 [Aliterella atlantica CENA595]
MPLLSLDELKTLVENPQKPCISLYMPVLKAGAEFKQNPIRFKNLIRQVEQRLDEIGILEPEASALLKQAQELDTLEFWENHDDGLAIFISPQLFRYYSLPVEFQELVVVSDQFHLKPLLALINSDRRFYILALSQKDVRFFEATPYNVKEVKVQNMPHSLDEALNLDETAKEGQFRIAASKGGTSNSFAQPGAFHGQGSPDRDKHQEQIRQFFHAVDDALHQKLRNRKAPLILAAVEYLHPIYKEANTYQHLVEEGITGNPEILKPEELQAQAWQIVEPILNQAEQAAKERYQELAGSDTGKASSDPQEIIPAAYFQRVDALFVPVGKQLWGEFDPDNMTVYIHPEAEADDEDMLDFAAIHTLLNGGTVYAVEPDNVPDGATAAAIFRY